MKTRQMKSSRCLHPICSALVWDSMSNGAKLGLLMQAILAVGMRMWSETWEQCDWPHELSIWAERNAISRLTERQNAEAVATASADERKSD